MNIKHFFTGCVEDVNDPEQMGRVRVRCFGYHSTKQSDIPTHDLPWATCIMPVTSASVSGIGTSATGLLAGSWVIGFFRDGDDMQDPVVLGSIGSASGYDNGLDVTGRAFSDPNGYFPNRIGLDIPMGSTTTLYAKSQNVNGQTTSRDVFNSFSIAQGSASSTLQNPSTPISVNSSGLQSLISIAQGEVGTLETSKNQGPGIAKYWSATNYQNGYANREPWCAAFVCWCIKQAGIFSEFDRPKTASAFKNGGGFESWAQSKGSVAKLNYRPTTIKKGDLVIYSFSHIGIATSNSDANGSFTTIEGNTNGAGERDGNGVYVKKRNLSSVRSTISIVA